MDKSKVTIITIIATIFLAIIAFITSYIFTSSEEQSFNSETAITEPSQ